MEETAVRLTTMADLTLADIDIKYSAAKMCEVHKPSKGNMELKVYIEYLETKLKSTEDLTIESLDKDIEKLETRIQKKLAHISEKAGKPHLEELKRVIDNKELIESFIRQYRKDLQELLQIKKKVLAAKLEEEIEVNNKKFLKPHKIYEKEIEEVGWGDKTIKSDKRTREYCGSCSVGSSFLELEDKTITEKKLCDCKKCTDYGMFTRDTITEKTPISACTGCSFLEVGTLVRSCSSAS